MMRRIAMAGIGAVLLAAVVVPDAMAKGTPGTAVMHAYYDADHDGAEDVDEQVIAGMRFFLDSDNDGGLDATETVFTTSESGNVAHQAFGGTLQFRPVPDSAQSAALRGLTCTEPSPTCMREATISQGSLSFLPFGFWRSGDDDGDRFAEPQDCDDTAKGIKPGALEIPGNAVDENCDAVAPPFPGFSSSYDIFGNGAIVLRQYNVTDVFPHGTVEVTCDGRGCAFSHHVLSFPGGSPRARIGGLFERRKLKPGTVITVVVSAPDTLGMIDITTVRKNRTPKDTFGCVQPGSSTPEPCPS